MLLIAAVLLQDLVSAPFAFCLSRIKSIFFDAWLVRSNRLVKSNKMQQNVAKTGWELTKVARIGRSRSVYGQKRAEGGVGQSREPKLSVCWLRTSAHPFLAKNRPGAPVFGYCPIINIVIIVRRIIIIMLLLLLLLLLFLLL